MALRRCAWHLLCHFEALANPCRASSVRESPPPSRITQIVVSMHSAHPHLVSGQIRSKYLHNTCTTRPSMPSARPPFRCTSQLSQPCRRCRAKRATMRLVLCTRNGRQSVLITIIMSPSLSGLVGFVAFFVHRLCVCLLFCSFLCCHIMVAIHL